VTGTNVRPAHVLRRAEGGQHDGERDLSRHEQYSGKKLSYFDEARQERDPDDERPDAGKPGAETEIDVAALAERGYVEFEQGVLTGLGRYRAACGADVRTGACRG